MDGYLQDGPNKVNICFAQSGFKRDVEGTLSHGLTMPGEVHMAKGRAPSFVEPHGEQWINVY